MKIIELNIEGYQRVVEAIDENFHCIVAIHNTSLGPALGGCRVMPYENREAQLQDALRLSKGMTYKSSLAGLNLGGGKATINARKADYKTLFKFAEVLEYINLGGVQYFTSGDVGTGPGEVELLATMTDWVNGQHLGEDSGYATAYGVYMSMLGALKFKNLELRKQFIGLEGLGKVGGRLLKLLHNEASSIFTYDVDDERSRVAHLKFKSTSVDSLGKLLRYSTVYSPCALGGTLNIETLKTLKPGDIVCGGANNQFSEDGMAKIYHDKGVIVVPDYLANAGGVIIISEGFQDDSWKSSHVLEKLRKLQFTSETVLQAAKDEDKTPMFIANRMAEERFK